MNLRQYCYENNLCCATCMQSYKNYINEKEYKMFCVCCGSLVNEKYVCMYYISK